MGRGVSCMRGRELLYGRLLHMMLLRRLLRVPFGLLLLQLQRLLRVLLVLLQVLILLLCRIRLH